MKGYTHFCLSDYGSVAHPEPAEQDPLSYIELKALAEADGYQKYFDTNAIPYNQWDALPGEDADETWEVAMKHVAVMDGLELYGGEDELSPVAADFACKMLVANTVRCLQIDAGCIQLERVAA